MADFIVEASASSPGSHAPRANPLPSRSAARKDTKRMDKAPSSSRRSPVQSLKSARLVSEQPLGVCLSIFLSPAACPVSVFGPLSERGGIHARVLSPLLGDGSCPLTQHSSTGPAAGPG